MDYLTRGSDYLAQYPDFKLVGREHELERLCAILMRATANSVVLVGPGGAGVTALAMGLQALKSEDSAPFDIIAKRLYWLDVDSLFSSGDATQINKAFSKIMNYLSNTNESILLIEDTKDFIEACRNCGTSHFMNDIMSAVKRNLTQVILETRDDDLETVMRIHSDVREHFTMFDITEPVSEALQKITEKTSEKLAKVHGIKIDPQAITMAIELTTKYRTRDASLSRAQPERSATLLDRALASYRLSAHRDVPVEKTEKLREYYRNLRDGEKHIDGLEVEIEKILADKGLVIDPNLPNMETKEVTEKRREISQVKVLVDENRVAFDTLTEEINSKLLLTKEMVMEEFAQISGIPSSKLGENEREKLKNLEQVLKSRIFGQDEAVEKLANAVKTARVVKRHKDQPQAAFMFIGPSGTGKTEISKALTEALLDDEKALTRFDMSEYMEKHSVAKLIGAPAGYEGFEAGGVLTNAMRQNPNRVILFDEIEKAHPDVFNVFLSILSDSRLTDNMGRTVSFNNTILIFTSNIGQPHFLDMSLTFDEAKVHAITELNSTYKSEFLNRFAGRQNIVCFKRLEIDNIEKIVVREFNKLFSVYQDSGLRVNIAPETITVFCSDNYDPVIGARGLPGLITANLEPKLVNLLLEGFTGSVDVSYDRELKSFVVKGSANV